MYIYFYISVISRSYAYIIIGAESFAVYLYHTHTDKCTHSYTYGI